MAALGILLQLVAVVLVIIVIIKISAVFWRMLAWLHTEISPATPRAFAIRVGGMIIGLIFSLLSLLFAYIWVSLNRIGYSAPWRPLWSAWTFIPAAIPLVFSFCILYLCFCTRSARTFRMFRWNVSPLALGLTLLAESCAVFIALLLLRHMGYVWRG